MKNFWRKKIIFIWRKVDICFEMVQSGTTVPKKRAAGGARSIAVSFRGVSVRYEL